MTEEAVDDKGKEISLFEIMVEIMLRWRMLLLAMLLGGILFGAYSYIRSLQSIKVQTQTAAEQRTEQEQLKGMSQEEITADWDNTRAFLKSQLNEAQQSNVEMALMQKKLYDQKAMYCQNSLLMNLNPLCVQRAELIFIVKADSFEDAYRITDAYKELMLSTELYEYVQSQCEIESGVSELIALSNEAELGVLQGANIIDSNMISLMISYNDSEICSNIADVVVKFIEEEENKMENELGSHEIILLNRSQGEVIDSSIQSRQENFILTMYSLQNTYNTIMASFSTEELQYYNHMLSKDAIIENSVNFQDKVMEEETTEITFGPKVNVLYIILGAAIFAFIYMAWVFVKYIFNDKVRTIDDLQRIYGIAQLGMVPVKRKKHLGVTLDQWIMKLRYHGKRKFDPQEATALTEVAIKIAVKKQNLNKVYLVGCDISNSTALLCEQIKLSLRKEDIETIILSNVLYNAEMLAMLDDAQGVVLVETAGATLYDEIWKEIQLLKRQDILLLGGVIAE